MLRAKTYRDPWMCSASADIAAAMTVTVTATDLTVSLPILIARA
jgi:hypothetical protein